RLAGAELDASVADEIERGDALGDAGRMVVAGRAEHDPVSQADALRALARGRQEHLGRGGMRILFEEVMFDLPGEVDAESIGQRPLVERVLKQLQLAAVVPGAWQLVLIEDAELHVSSPFFSGCTRVRRACGREPGRRSWRRSRLNCRSRPLMLRSMRRS